MEAHPPGEAPGARALGDGSLWLGLSDHFPSKSLFSGLASSLKSPGTSPILRKLRASGEEAEEGWGRNLDKSWPQFPYL